MDRIRRYKLIVLFQVLFSYVLIFFVLMWVASCTYNFKYDIVLIQGEGAKIGDIVVINEKPKQTTVSTDTQASVMP